MTTLIKEKGEINHGDWQLLPIKYMFVIWGTIVVEKQKRQKEKLTRTCPINYNWQYTIA